MRIAFDLDGVLADLHGPFVRAAVALYPELEASAIGAADIGASPPDSESEAGEREAPDPQISVPLTRRQSDAVWRHLAARENFWESLDEIEAGTIARIAALADEHRWEVIFITSRPSSSGATVQRQSQRWLAAHGFALPSVYVVHGSRGRVAEALDLEVVMDDRPENCLDVVLESKAGAILIWRGPQATVPASARRLGIAVTSTVGAGLDAILEAERSAGDGGLLDRLRRLFGVKTKPSSGFLR